MRFKHLMTGVLALGAALAILSTPYAQEAEAPAEKADAETYDLRHVWDTDQAYTTITSSEVSLGADQQGMTFNMAFTMDAVREYTVLEQDEESGVSKFSVYWHAAYVKRTMTINGQVQDDEGEELPIVGKTYTYEWDSEEEAWSFVEDDAEADTEEATEAEEGDAEGGEPAEAMEVDEFYDEVLRESQDQLPAFWTPVEKVAVEGTWSPTSDLLSAIISDAFTFPMGEDKPFGATFTEFDATATLSSVDGEGDEQAGTYDIAYTGECKLGPKDDKAKGSMEGTATGYITLAENLAGGLDVSFSMTVTPPEGGGGPPMEMEMPLSYTSILIKGKAEPTLKELEMETFGTDEGNSDDGESEDEGDAESEGDSAVEPE